MQPGNQAAFTAVIKNTGNVILDENFAITFTQEPSGVTHTFGEVTVDTGKVTTVSNNTITWEGSLEVDKSLTINAIQIIAETSTSGTLNSKINPPIGWSITGSDEASLKIIEPSNIITTVAFNNKTPKAGDKFTGTATLENTGGSDYTTDQVIDFTRSGTSAFSVGQATVKIGTVTESGLKYTVKATIAPGEIQTIEVPCEALEAGTVGNTITATLSKPTGKTSGTLTDVATWSASESATLKVNHKRK